MLEEIDQYESPLLWVLVHVNYFDDTLVRSFQADFRRRFQAPSFSTVSSDSRLSRSALLKGKIRLEAAS